MWWLWLAACGGGTSDPGAGCDVPCPEGTRRIETLSTEVVVESQFSWSRTGACEVLCEAIQPCLAPNVPVVDGDTDPATFACVPMDGLSSIPLPTEVDTSFATRWHEVADPVASSLPFPAAYLFAHDGDADGFDDLYAASATQVAFLRSNGDGTFTDAGSQPLPQPGFRWLGAGDWDGDGRLDLAWLDWDGNLVWARGAGPLAWDPPRAVAVGAPLPYLPVGMDAVDLDGDGADDLILQNWSIQPRIAVFFGSPTGPGDPNGLPLSTAEVEVRVGWGDLDGDGLLDVVSSGNRGGVYRQGPGRSFSTVVESLWPTDAVVSAVGLQDLDGDGLDDLWRAEVGGWSTWTSTGTGLVEGPPTAWDGLLSGFGARTDVDGDGRPDPVLATTDGRVVFQVGFGAGEVGWMDRLSPVQAYVVAAGDFDGDGLGEAAVSDGPGLAVVFP